MSGWRATIYLAALAGLLYWLHPPRQMEREPEGDATEISYMAPGGVALGAMGDSISQFEKHSRQRHQRDPKQKAYRVIVGANAMRDWTADPTRLLVAVAGDMPPDVMYFGRFALAEWAARGVFEPLDRFVAADERRLAALEAQARERALTAAEREERELLRDTPGPARYYAAAWDECAYTPPGEGKPRVYGVPISIDNRCLYYNKSLLQKAGLVYGEMDPEAQAGKVKAGEAKPPRTWEELRAYTVRLTEWTDARKQDFKVVGFAPQYGNSWLYFYAWMNGGEFMSPDGRECTMNDPKVVEALTYIRELYDSIGGYEKVNGFQRSFGGNELDPFITGKVAMKIDGVWVLSGLARYGRGLDFGVAPAPVPAAKYAQGFKVSWAGGWALAMPATLPEARKQAAWEFIRYMCSDEALRLQQENQRQILEAQGELFMPAQCPVQALNEEFFRKYVAGKAREDLPQPFVDAMQCFNDMLPYSRYRPVTPVGQRLWNAHTDAMEAGLYRKMEPQAALDFQTAVVQRDLDDFFTPRPGRPITSWTWFFVLYGGLVLGLATVVYYWDTCGRFRARLGRLLPGRRAEGAAGVIPGANGSYFRQQWKQGLLCAAPWLLGFLIFGGGPMLFSIVMSLCDYDVVNTPRFIGTHNYTWMFAHDHIFYTALWNTGWMVVVGLPLSLILGLAIALLLNAKVRGMATWRTLFYLPAIMPTVAAAVLWVWVLNPSSGLLNQFLRFLHADELLRLVFPGAALPGWITDPAWAKPALVLMGLWGVGGSMIIWLAGLKGIPEALYEAAAVDGAGAWRRFWHVTIPQLTPYIFFNLIMGMIGTFQIFESAYIMTDGGPANSTMFYVMHLFNNAFRYGKMGQAAAMAWVLVVLVLVLTVVQLKLAKRWVHYEAE